MLLFHLRPCKLLGRKTLGTCMWGSKLHGSLSPMDLLLLHVKLEHIENLETLLLQAPAQLVIAFGITIRVGLHAISHLACDFPRLLAATEEEYEPMEQYFGEQPLPIGGLLGESRVGLRLQWSFLMAIAFTLATPWLRRGKLNLTKPLKKLTGF
ncbi:hypothetical protein Tco_1268259 [Tanacetum coccineum]